MANPIQHAWIAPGEYADGLAVEIGNLKATITRLTAEKAELVEGATTLADAADTVGVAHFDTDDMSEEVTAMQEATISIRSLLQRLGGAQ